jgi:hypothetical protein
MSDTTIDLPTLDLGDDESNDARVSLKRSDIRRLEAAAKAGLQAQTAKTQADRELAFYKAGIDPSDTRLSYFVKGYDGEMTPEAIKAEAQKAGFVSAEGQTAASAGSDSQSTEAENAEKQAAALSGGASTPGSTLNAEAGRQALAEAMKQGGVSAMLEKARELGLPIAGDD